jgi:hypothetical protein
VSKVERRVDVFVLGEVIIDKTLDVLFVRQTPVNVARCIGYRFCLCSKAYSVFDTSPEFVGDKMIVLYQIATTGDYLPCIE